MATYSRTRVPLGQVHWRISMLILTWLFLQFGASRAPGVILSAPGWDYVIVPGERLFGVDFDGVVRVRDVDIGPKLGEIAVPCLR